MSRRITEVAVVPSSPTVVGVYTGRPGTQGPTGPTGPQGPQGVTGPTGPGASADPSLPTKVAYRHTQSATSNTWVITHNLRFYPNVTAFDSANNMVEGTIEHTANNTLSIAFSAAISGTAILS